MPKPEKDFISQEMDWLLETIEWRWDKEFEGRENKLTVFPPEVNKENSPYEYLIHHFKLTESQRLVVALSIANFFMPNTLNRYVTFSSKYEPLTYGSFNKFDSYFKPTGITVLFLLYGNNFSQRLKGLKEFKKHPLLVNRWISLGDRKPDEPVTSGTLCVASILIDYLSEEISFDYLISTLEPTPNVR